LKRAIVARTHHADDGDSNGPAGVGVWDIGETKDAERWDDYKVWRETERASKRSGEAAVVGYFFGV
jgi:hypothetical protein